MNLEAPSSDYPNPSVVELAEAFYEVSVTPGCPVIPRIVNACLSIELNLKSLMVKYKYHNPIRSTAVISGEEIEITSGQIIGDRAPQASHKLSQLLNKIPCEMLPDFEKTLDQVHSLSISELENLLKPFDSAFVDFRYAYEMPSKDIDLRGLRHVTDIVHQTIQNMPTRTILPIL